jgi:thymidylate synthase
LTSHTGASVNGATIAEAWEQGLRLFQAPAELFRHDSERGVAFEITGMSLVIESAEDLTVPARYRFPGLVTDYTERLFGADRDLSMLYQRMRNWPTADGHAIDQLAQVQEMLTTSPDTRAAAFTLWRPEDDLHSAFPVSPVSGCLRIITGRLQLHLVARSVDYWVGAVPELVAYGRLTSELAGMLLVRPGPIVFHMWSAHIYEDDCLAHVAVPGDTSLAGSTW